MKKSLGPKPLVYPTPVFVVATYGPGEQANAMTVAWAGLCCSQPPCVAVSVRKATQTYSNLVQRQAFTLNIPSESLVRQVDALGLMSGREVNKLAVTGLTAERSLLVDAPYLQEFPVVLECRVIHTLELGLHVQFIGEVLDIKAEETVVSGGGLLDVQRVRPFCFTPDTQAYYGLGGFLGRAFEIGRPLTPVTKPDPG